MVAVLSWFQCIKRNIFLPWRFLFQLSFPVLPCTDMEDLSFAMIHWLQNISTNYHLFLPYFIPMKFIDYKFVLSMSSSLGCFLTLYFSCCDSVNMTRHVANMLHPVRLHMFSSFLPSGCWLEEIFNGCRRVVLHLPLGGTVPYSWDDECQVRLWVRWYICHLGELCPAPRMTTSR